MQPNQQYPVMPDDHSEVVPLLPIPNRTVKRLCANDSADSRVKVGHRQATPSKQNPLSYSSGGFAFIRLKMFDYTVEHYEKISTYYRLACPFIG